MIKHESHGEIMEQAQERFNHLQSARTLMDTTLTGSYSASRLYQFIGGHNDPALEAALFQNLSLRRAYKTLLTQMAYFHIPQAIAASSEVYPARDCQGCRIRLQASRAESSQLYLIIEISDQRRDMPTKLSAFQKDEAYAQLDLPDARNGVIQTIIEIDSDLASLLKDPKVEIYLR